MYFRDYSFDGIDMSLTDSTEDSFAVGSIVGELEGYKLDIEVNNGDVMVDVGGHCGVVSVYFGKKYPKLQIYSYEPFKRNYLAILDNLKRNNVTNVKPFNLAISSDGRKVRMQQHSSNTGGSTFWHRNQDLHLAEPSKEKSGYDTAHQFDFAKSITKDSNVQVVLVNDQKDLNNFFKKNLIENEIVICMGAGSISKWLREMKF